MLTIVQNLKASFGLLSLMMRKEIVFVLVDMFGVVGVTLLPNHVILPDSSIADVVLTMEIAAFPIQLNGGSVVLVDDEWCRGCQAQGVTTVRNTGVTGKHWCRDCWGLISLSWISARFLPTS